MFSLGHGERCSDSWNTPDSSSGFSNAYLVKIDTETLVLIDTGTSSGGAKKLKEISGFGGLMKIERVKPDIMLKDGDTIGHLTVIHTPGHTDESICIYKPGKALFVGDTLRTDGSGYLKRPSGFMSRDMGELRRPVEKISKLEFSMLLPRHGKPIVENAFKKLKEFVANRFK